MIQTKKAEVCGSTFCVRATMVRHFRAQPEGRKFSCAECVCHEGVKYQVLEDTNIKEETFGTREEREIQDKRTSGTSEDVELKMDIEQKTLKKYHEKENCRVFLEIKMLEEEIYLSWQRNPMSKSSQCPECGSHTQT